MNGLKLFESTAQIAPLAHPAEAVPAAGHSGEHHHPGFVAQALDLDKYQVELLRLGMESAREQQRQLQLLRQQLSELVSSGDYTESEATAIASQICQLATQQALAEFRVRNDFHQSLSEDQKSKLAQIDIRRGPGKPGEFLSFESGERS